MSVIIRLQNLPWSANASNIRRFFSGMNIPEGGVHIVGGENGDAFIGFSTDDDARRAMLLDGQALNGAAVRLMLSSLAEMQVVIAAARAPQDSSQPISQDSYARSGPQYQDDYQQSHQRFPAYQLSEQKQIQDPLKRYTVYEPPSSEQRPVVRDYQVRSEQAGGEYNQPPQEYGHPPQDYHQPSRDYEHPAMDFNQPPRNNARGFNQPSRDFGQPQRDFNQAPNDLSQPQGDFQNSDYGYPPQEYSQSSEYRQPIQQSNWSAGGYDNEYPGRMDTRAYSSEPQRKDGSKVEEYMPPRPADSSAASRNTPGVSDAYGYSQPSNPNDEYYYGNDVRRSSEPEYGNGSSEYNQNTQNFGPGFGRPDQPISNREGRFGQPQRDGFRPRPFDTDSSSNFNRPRPYQEGNNQNRGGPNRNQWGPEGNTNDNQYGNERTIQPPFSRDDRFGQGPRWGRPETSREEFGQEPRQPQRSDWGPGDMEDPYAESGPAPDRDFSVKPPWLRDLDSNRDHGPPRDYGPPRGQGLPRDQGPPRDYGPPRDQGPSRGQVLPGDYGSPRDSAFPQDSGLYRGSPLNSMKRPSPAHGMSLPTKVPRTTAPPSQDYHQGSEESNDKTVILLKMSPASVNIKKIFSILWGVHIVPKWGVRIELDTINRPTGYVLVKLSSSSDCEKAVSYTGKKVDGYAVEIQPSSDDVFYSILDKGKTTVAPPSDVRIGPSVYLADKCLELTGLIPNLNKKDLLNFLGLPNFPVERLFLGNFGGVPPSIRGFIKLDTEQNVSSVMQKNNTSFQGKCTIKLCTISNLQREKYMSEALTEKKELKPPPPPVPIKKPEPVLEKKSEPTPVKMTPASKQEDSRYSCLELTNLPKFATLSEVRAFLGTSFPEEKIKLQGDKNRGFAEFPNELECRRSLSVSRRPLRGCTVKLRVITRTEMLNSIGLENKIEEKSIPTDNGKTTNEPRYSVVMSNLPMNYTVDKVRDFFKGFLLVPSTPVVLKMSAQGKPLGEGSVYFKSAIEADRAIRELKGCRLAGREIMLKYQS